MVSKITIFEPHINELGIGDVVEETSAVDDSDDAEGSGKRRRLRRIIPTVLAMGLLIGLAVRRLRGNGEEGIEIEEKSTVEKLKP